MSRLRFAMVTTFYPPFNFGGDGLAVQHLARALVRRGHQVTVLHDVDAYNALHVGDNPERDGTADGVDVVSLRSPLNVLSPMLTQQTGRPVANRRQIQRVLGQRPPDVTNFHNVSLVGGPGILAAGGGVKIYTAHEHWLVCPTHTLWRHGREICTNRECLRCVLHHRRPPQLWRYTGYLRRQLRHIDAFIAFSEFSRDKHREFGFPRPMEVIPGFLPSPDSAPAPSSGKLPRDNRPFFLFVGRLEPIKGLQDLIPVFRDYRSADLVVAGEGTQAAALRRMAADAPHIRFLGHVPSRELAAHYRDALAVIVPSIGYETFGFVLIEAFRHATPVIARRLGSFPEIMSQCRGGELFGDRAELMAALHRVQHDPTHRANLSRAALRGFTERWAEDVVVPRYLSVIRRAAASRGQQGVVAALEGETAA